MKPSIRTWLVTLAAIAGIALTLSLGRWQLARADQKLAIEAALRERQAAPVLSARELAALDDFGPQLHRRVQLRGRWLAAATVYLDNRQMHGRPGFYVVTPLQLADAARVVIVQRGWIPRDFEDRTRLVPVQTPDGIVEIEGRVANLPSALLTLGAEAKAPVSGGSSRIRQNLDLDELRAQTRADLPAGSVVQTDPASDGLQRDWPEIGSGVDKHYGYAFQWFGLSALIATLYVWFQILVPRRRRARRN
jgi:surfeit locus 1 family protein